MAIPVGSGIAGASPYWSLDSGVIERHIDLLGGQDSPGGSASIWGSYNSGGVFALSAAIPTGSLIYSTATGSASWRLLAEDGPRYTLASPNVVRFKTRLNMMDVAPSAAENYEVFVGFLNSRVPTAPQGAGFRWRWGGAAAELVAWSNNGVATTTVALTAPTTGAWVTWEVVASASSVRFLIGGVLVATITTNIPTQQLLSAVYILKSAGTTERRIEVDAMSIRYEFPPR